MTVVRRRVRWRSTRPHRAASDVLQSLTPSERRTARRFAVFHDENPQVYTTLVHLARTGKAAGLRRLGIKQLYEVARWELGLQTNGKPFKMDNSFTAAYARLIMLQEPDLTGIFTIRGENWVPLTMKDFDDVVEL